MGYRCLLRSLLSNPIPPDFSHFHTCSPQMTQVKSPEITFLISHSSLLSHRRFYSTFVLHDQWYFLNRLKDFDDTNSSD